MTSSEITFAHTADSMAQHAGLALNEKQRQRYVELRLPLEDSRTDQQLLAEVLRETDADGLLTFMNAYAHMFQTELLALQDTNVEVVH